MKKKQSNCEHNSWEEVLWNVKKGLELMMNVEGGVKRSLESKREDER